ncbi:MAG: hypothetical protein WAL25_08885 [Acidimicrobiia bacterium]
MYRVDDDTIERSWRQLGVYRERYPIEHLLQGIESLERSIDRRRSRRAALQRRLDELERQTTAVRSELRGVEAEIGGSLATGALLIDDILERVKRDNSEGWSPTPVRGFRVWSIRDNAIFGNQTQWQAPTLSGRCLRQVPGEDIPHSMARCGPPACGIYAVKDLDMFPSDVATSQINHTVVGVVAMAGKVVEHQLGYRAQRATTVAAVAFDDRRRVFLRQPQEIDELFTDPDATIARLTNHADPSPTQARELLEFALLENDPWT